MTRVRLRHVVDVNPATPRFDRLPPNAEVTFLPMEAVWPADRLDRSRTRRRVEVANGYTRFQDGDVLVPKITPTFEASRSVLVDGLVNGVGAGTTELHVLRARPDIDARFLYYVVQTHQFLKLGEAAMYGVAGQQRVPDDFIRDYVIELPALGEQRRIADFLAAEVTRIDRLISLRQYQIELLGQRELARAFDALRGTGEPGPRVDSGIPWMGDIPASWPVAPVWSQFDVQLGKMLNQERTRGNHLRPYLRNINVQWDRITLDDLLRMDFPPSERERYRVVPGDLLICEGGEPGRAAIWRGEVNEIYYQKALHRARSRGRSLVRWLYYCLRVATALSVFAVEGNVTTIGHLTGEQLRSRRFPFPDPSVQDRIVRLLDSANEDDRHVRNAFERQIDLLTERRTALITEAVGRRFDVTTAWKADFDK